MSFKIVKNMMYIVNLFLLIISGYVYSKGSHFGVGFFILVCIYFPIFISTLIFLLIDLYLLIFDKESKLRSGYFFIIIGVLGWIGQIIVNIIIQN